MHGTNVICEGQRKLGEKRTTSELRVPSSTTCVETMALPSNVQNSAATVPAWIAVKTTSAVDPCCRTAPVVRSWNGNEMKYRSRKTRNSERPARGGTRRILVVVKCEGSEGNAPTAALLRVVMIISRPTTIMLRPHAIMLAIFPSEPSSPALRAPHSGLMPTGAIVASAERPVSEVGELFSSYE